MLTRRECLTRTAQSCAALALAPRLVASQESGAVIGKAIPSTDEMLPVIGLGSSASFQDLADNGDTAAVRAVLEAMLEHGAAVFDTAPSYGSSEEVAGRVVQEMGATDRVFWATKLNVVRGFGGGGTADPAAARAQVEQSLERYPEPIDLIQVHNIADMDTQFPILQEHKAVGRVRYIGTTSTFKPQYEALAGYMRELPLDFIGIDYAVDNTSAADELFPIARDRGIAIMVYMPFGRTRLWDRVAGHEVPDWAREFGAETWAQFFLKFAAAHPDVTVVTPATSDPGHMADNANAARGRLPDADEQRRMIEHIESLPEA
ncbi:MAG TPA: aldo/keto reductase [Gammaproteobacteria bacterium]|nr:aldo/keto reductase [Gammaproteobacteria bacterium]